MSVGDIIKVERLRKGWSQETLSKLSGVSKSAIATVEKNRSNISLQVACCLADCLDISLDYLAGRLKK